MSEESKRLAELREGKADWQLWGPYLSERQWGTVREDYSPGGTAWDYFSHDQARSRAYRWGEDGLAGLSDEKQRLCFALAFWNGADPILKERLFGLTNSEGNHGEDVKEYYFYLDNTPTHSLMKYLYKYPQSAYPYTDLVGTNRRRGRHELEYELLDTGVFEGDRYFDLLVEYAKAAPHDILIRVTATNRAKRSAALHVLPTLWFRNTWSADPDGPRPLLREHGEGIRAEHPELGAYVLAVEGPAELLFTDNETNAERLFGTPNPSRFVKDSINDFVVHGRRDSVNPAREGTKAAPHYVLSVPAAGSAVVRLRLSREPAPAQPFGSAFDETFGERQREADAFYAAMTPPGVGADAAAVMRQALAGMLWTKQYYYFDVNQWLRERGADYFAAGRRPNARNAGWFHMINDHVISMPDKWEYPWYAAWDLAFHAIALAMVDPDFAKRQLSLMLHERYLHPNGQIPAYEWNFGDVNPPVHAWATLFVYRSEKLATGVGDLQFLRTSFHKLLLNFTWWLNRKDPAGRNVFEGGFLGLDNIGVFDRSAPLPTGGQIDQADGTAWMAMYCQNMLDIALELALHDPIYEDHAAKFVEHFFWIAAAMVRIGEGHDELWDEQDGFFYDVVRLPDGHAFRLKVRSMVGLLPLCAVTVLEPEALERFPDIVSRVDRFLERYPELTAAIAPPDRPGVRGRNLLAILDERRLRRVLARMLDPDEFLSGYGIRALSRYHRDHPYVFTIGDQVWRVGYEPAESSSGLFGGNSNWRGPVWFPVNALIIRALLQLYAFYGDDLRVECPTGSGRLMTLFEISREIADRLIRIFLRDEHGRRPVYGATKMFESDPHWRDLILFYEYFHGDNGAGIGASHQTGWTGLAARLIQLYAELDAKTYLDAGWRPVRAPAREAAAEPNPGPSVPANRGDASEQRARDAASTL